MIAKLPQGLSFQRTDHRAEFERARAAFKGAVKSLPFDDAVAELGELGAALDGAVARLKRDLLGSALCWNEDNHALTGWIHQQHRKLADAAHGLLEESAEALPVRLVAFVLHHEGEAAKWIAGRERPELAALNALVSRAFVMGTVRRPFNWSADGRGYETTLEAMYVRVLLLDRLGTGVLTRQQVEVLDAWLREWRDDLHLFEARREGAALHVDLDGAQGLRAETPAAGGRVLWLALGPLERRRREVMRDLQRGRIVPAYGCAAEFRIEEHVAVLRHLQRAFAAPAEAGARREARESAPGTRIEAWVGIREILARSGGSRGVETGQWRSLAACEPEAADSLDFTGVPDPDRRYLWLCDTSSGGCGFEALEQDAAGLEIGDLLGWRRGAAIALGRVIRRLPGKSAGQVFLGVRLLTDAALPFTLRRVDVRDGEGGNDYLFVPGDDASGRRDAFLVPESVHSHERAYRARVGDEDFALRFNRVRERGRGWILAGFEIVPPRPTVQPAVAAVEDADAFTLPETVAVAEEEPADPWSHEVPMRLLD